MLANHKAFLFDGRLHKQREKLSFFGWVINSLYCNILYVKYYPGPPIDFFSERENPLKEESTLVSRAKKQKPNLNNERRKNRTNEN